MPKIDIFLDSSALVAGIISDQGAARALLMLGEDEKNILTVCEQVITEVERNIARKVPKALPFARAIILDANIRVLRDPPIEEVIKHLGWNSHVADVSILVSARHANVDFLATLNTKHFLSDPEVSKRSGVRIGTPGEALHWIRENLGKFSD